MAASNTWKKGNAGILTCWSTSAGCVLITVVSTVVVTITSPVIWDTSTAGALELGVGAGPDAAHFITAISAVIIYTYGQTLIKGVTSHAHLYHGCNVIVEANDRFIYLFKMLLFSPESQRHCTLTHRPLEQLNWVRGSQVGKAEKVCLQIHVRYNPSRS